MKQLLVFTLVASLCHAPAAFAAESLLQSATRVAQEMARSGEAVLTTDGRATAPAAVASARPAATATQAGPGLSESGLGKGKKILIGLAIAAAFIGIAYKIDHSVEDSTPSSKGERLD
jgi:hypothetical protein